MAWNNPLVRYADLSAGPPDGVEPFLDELSTGLFACKPLWPLASKPSPHTIWPLTIFKLGVLSVLKSLLVKRAAANSFAFVKILRLI
jgi:hypothetical protein